MHAYTDRQTGISLRVFSLITLLETCATKIWRDLDQCTDKTLILYTIYLYHHQLCIKIILKEARRFIQVQAMGGRHFNVGKPREVRSNPIRPHTRNFNFGTLTYSYFAKIYTYIKLRFCLYIGPNHAKFWLHTFQAKL